MTATRGAFDRRVEAHIEHALVRAVVLTFIARRWGVLYVAPLANRARMYRNTIRHGRRK